MSENVRPGKNFVLAVALAHGESTTQAAERAGICERTVRRKLNKPAFARLVSRLRDQMISQALGAMARPKPTFQNLQRANLNDFLTVSLALENTGVGAYLGAAPVIFDRGILGAAASVSSSLTP